MANIFLEQVWKRYGSVEAVRNLSLDCPDGQLLALLGPSGCGKTSTLKMIAGIESISGGEIFFGGRPVSGLDPAARNVALVFEDYALYPHLTVAQNIAFPLEVRRRPLPEIRRAVGDALALLGLETLRDVNVRQLSGGAQQRVAIGRALVRRPVVVLFDEPLSHLDGSHKVQLRAEIKRLQKETGVTGILVTHDQTEAMAMADRVAVMNLGELQQVGSPQELYDHPANLFVAQFVGEPPMNLLPGTLRAHRESLVVEGRGWQAPLPPAIAARLRAVALDQHVLLGARPEHLRLSPADAATAGAALVGSIFFRELRGDDDIVLIKLDRALGPGSSLLTDEVIAVVVPPDSVGKEGDPVQIGLPAEELLVFDARRGANLLAA
jgi:multiple sugar transport system ATP-binding protein